MRTIQQESDILEKRLRFFDCDSLRKHYTRLIADTKEKLEALKRAAEFDELCSIQSTELGLSTSTERRNAHEVLQKRHRSASVPSVNHEVCS